MAPWPKVRRTPGEHYTIWAYAITFGDPPDRRSSTWTRYGDYTSREAAEAERKQCDADFAHRNPNYQSKIMRREMVAPTEWVDADT